MALPENMPPPYTLRLFNSLLLKMALIEIDGLSVYRT